MTRLASAVVLECHDILATIFDHLAPGPTIDPDDPDNEEERLRRRCRDALAASAMCCSIISYHALNVLWRELDNIQPLLKVLPNYKRFESGFKLCGPILPGHWTRFQLYADRVRVILGSPREWADLVHPSVSPFLAARCKGSPLMPRLRRLIADNVLVPQTSAFILLLLSPTLRLVDISFELEFDDESDIAPLLHTLPLMAPDLEDLTLSIDYGRNVDVGHGYLESFGQHFTRLKTLSLQCAIRLDGTVLHLLSSIPTLKDLTCTVYLDDGFSELAGGHNRLTFQELASIDVSGDLDHLVIFFHICQLPSLVRTHLRISGPSEARGPEDSLAAICQHFNTASLTSFSIDIRHPCAGDLRLRSLMQYSEPLLAFPNVTSFRFMCLFIVPPVHDSDLVRFGTAWPRLESFHVGHLVAQLSLPDVMRPTLSGIIALAQRCPRLERFHVSELDVSVIPPRSEIPFARHCVRRFKVNNVVPELPSSMYMHAAAVLDRAFPDIDLEYAWSSSHLDGPQWGETLRFLEAMRLGRENSELRAKLLPAPR